MKRALALALAALPLLAPGRAAADFFIPIEDHVYHVRTTFDPDSRMWIGSSAALLRGPEGPAAEPELDVGLAHATTSTSGTGPEAVSWYVDHRVLAGWVVPRRGAGGGAPPLDAALYGVSMMRHDTSPRIVLPTSPPRGIPFPFDVGFVSEVGRVTIDDRPASTRGDGAPAAHVGVVRADLVLDPWRSGRPGQFFEIGLGGRYDLDAYTAASGAPGPGAPGVRVVHRVAPMTAGSLGLHLRSRDGLLSLACRGEVVPHFTSEGGWKTMASATAHVERTFLALDDEPVSAVLDGGYRFVPATRDLDAVSDYRVSLGLAWSLPLTP